MKLHMYLAERRITKKAFGEKIGYNPAYVSLTCWGKKPGKKFIKAVIKETGGLVTEKDFADKSEKPVSETADLI